MDADQALAQLPGWCEAIGCRGLSVRGDSASFQLPAAGLPVALTQSAGPGWAMETQVSVADATSSFDGSPVDFPKLVSRLVQARAGFVSGEARGQLLVLRSVLFFDGLSQNAFSQTVLELDKAALQITATLEEVRSQAATFKQIADEHRALAEEAQRAIDEAERALKEPSVEEAPSEAPPAPSAAAKPTCSNCGAALADGAQFCIACGTPVAQQAAATPAPSPGPATCSNCQAPLAPDARFCIRCGTPVS
jgi:hypothetical protein